MKKLTQLIDDYNAWDADSNKNNIVKMLSLTGILNSVKLSYTSSNKLSVTMNTDNKTNALLFGNSNDIRYAFTNLVPDFKRMVKASSMSLTTLKVMKRVIDKYNHDHKVTAHFMAIRTLILELWRNHVMIIEPIFYTNIDIAHDLGVSIRKVNRLLHPNEFYNHVKLPHIDTIGITHQLEDNTGDIHWVRPYTRDKNGNKKYDDKLADLVKVDTSKHPYYFGQYKPQTVVSNRAYHLWKHMALDPVRQKLKKHNKIKYKYATRAELIHLLTANQYYRNYYHKKYLKLKHKYVHKPQLPDDMNPFKNL